MHVQCFGYGFSLAMFILILHRFNERYIHIQNALISFELQLGFKEGFSTTQSTYVLLENFSHYNYYVYSVLFDATKAFDIVHCCKLLNQIKLIYDFYYTYKQIKTFKLNGVGHFR